MDATTYSGRTDLRKLLATVAALLLLPTVLLTMPFLSPGPFLYGLIVFWVFATVAALSPYVHTVYHIEDDCLTYRSGLRWGRVPIDRIWRITRGTSVLGPNASGSYAGLRIQFFVGEVFIAPRHEAAFIADLLRINPNIVVKEARE